jgi:hypothetical protein
MVGRASYWREEPRQRGHLTIDPCRLCERGLEVVGGPIRVSPGFDSLLAFGHEYLTPVAVGSFVKLLSSHFQLLESSYLRWSWHRDTIFLGL